MTHHEAPDVIRLIHDCLHRIGYRNELILPNYEFWNFLAKSSTAKSSVCRIELAAFAQSPPSNRSACLGVTIPPNDSPAAVRQYRALGAPQIFAIHPRERYIRRWKIGANTDPVPIDTFAFDNIEAEFESRKTEWEPRRILNAKTLIYSDGPAQLDFFDFGLLPALEAALRAKLERQLNNILVRCKEVYTERYSTDEFDAVLNPLFRLIFRLIAAKMMIDRGSKPQWAELGAQSVIEQVEAFYFSDEQAAMVLPDGPVQKIAWQEVQQGLNLQNLTVETLAHLYENAFVTREVRQKQSVHATPQAVAEYILRQLPIQDIAEEERTVFEPFAGAAPFLVAALGRLRDLLPADMTPSDRHLYFVRMLSGIENDSFAREIARYSLILADYPNPDGWRIEVVADAYTGPEFDAHLLSARIVVCNPPYADFTQEERDEIGRDTAHSKEAEALRRVLAKRPLMLGFVLPRSFLERSDFRQLRLDIVDRYKNVSITVLPDKAFKKASQEVVLLIADNIRALDKPYSYSIVKSNEYRTFLVTGKPLWKVEYAAPVRRNNDVILWRSPLEKLWRALNHCPAMGDIAEIHVGVRYKTGLLSDCVKDDLLPDEPQANFKPGVANVLGYLEPYLIRDYKYLCTKSDVMRDKAYQRPWDDRKVLANRARTSREYWNIAGAIDEQGLFATQQYYGIWPKSNMPIEVLSAIISGPVANAFLFDFPSKVDNEKRWIKQIPIPIFTEERMELIVFLVQEYYSQRGQWIAEPERKGYYEGRCLELLFQIDAAVLEAYALPADLERELLTKFDGVERRPLPFHFPGYGDGYERAKVELQRKIEYRSALKHYHALVDKEFAHGLTGEEAIAMELLGHELEDLDAPLDAANLARLKSLFK